VLAGSAALWSVLRPHEGGSLVARVVRATKSDLRRGVLAHGAWPGVAVASAVAAAGHTAAFLVAARAAGSTASLARLLPLALVVLVAASIPTSIGGWGPREGVAAWVFAAAGLGAAQGVATSVVYGVMVTVATAPGLLVIAGRPVRRTARRRAGRPVAAAAVLAVGSSHG